MKAIRIGLFLWAISGLSCRTPAGPPAWDDRYVPALCTRAEALLAEGNAPAARDAAQDALTRSLARGDSTSEARARHILGLVDGSSEELEAALRLLEEFPPEAGEWRTRLMLGQLALQAAEFGAAEAHVQPVLDQTSAWDDIGQRAQAEALASHLLAAARRGQGKAAEARQLERWASLQLTILPDRAMRPLRRSVAMGLGDDLASDGQHEDAFREHAVAANLAAMLGDDRSLLEAVRAMSRDLARLDHLTDAMDHASRAVSLARELRDWQSAEDIARETLAWLDLSGEPWDSKRRIPFQQLLSEASQHLREDHLLGGAIDSTPCGG